MGVARKGRNVVCRELVSSGCGGEKWEMKAEAVDSLEGAVNNFGSEG